MKQVNKGSEMQAIHGQSSVKEGCVFDNGLLSEISCIISMTACFLNGWILIQI